MNEPSRLSPAEKASATRRVFFALWPDQGVRQKITQTFQASPFYQLKTAQPYHASNLHLTLHFLGNVSNEQLNCVRQQANRIKPGSFELALTHYGKFSRAAVLWMGPQSIPRELQQLHLQLGEALTECEYKPEAREYHPHITLMRKFHGDLENQSMPTIDWSVEQFALIESVQSKQGVVYKPLEFYFLDTE